MGPLLVLALACFTCSAIGHRVRTSYRAAVFEHARFGTQNDSSDVIVRTNLELYSKAAAVAKTKGAEVIVFPEYGIFPPDDRPQLKKFLEQIPDPRKELVNPCIEPENYEDRPILYTLSCMARNNSMVVVANTGDIQPCTGDDQCPYDGVFHFNTNVAFDRDGTLLVKYHKEHLYFELGMDLAREQQTPIFKTDFGVFATYICFDIIFSRMGEVGREVDAVFFSTMWFDNFFPQSVSVQMFQSWALGNNVSLLASNIQIPEYDAVGSGMFSGTDGAIAYTYNPDGISKLVVANVPKSKFSKSAVFPNTSITAITATEQWEIVDDGKDVPSECSIYPNETVGDINKNYRCPDPKMDNFTFVKLTEPSGRVEACNNGMCCSVEYTTSNGFGGESFYLGIFNGTYNSFDRYFWCEEDCLMARCDPHGGVPCGMFPLQSKTVFNEVHLTANFSTGIVYPQVLASGVRLVPLDDWHLHSYDLHYYGTQDSPSHDNNTHQRHEPPHLHHGHAHSHHGHTHSHHDHAHSHHNHAHLHHDHSHYHDYHEDGKPGERCVHYKNISGESLLSVGMKGRCYERDPPYVR